MSNQQPLSEELTEREIEILHLMAQGQSNSQIAHQLSLALETVKWYNRRLYAKLNVANRTEATNRARELGLLDGETTAVSNSVSIRHNLPASTTPFIGRETELAELAQLIQTDTTRLITILAPGGMGKTWFAIETARHFAEGKYRLFTNGVFFIPLAQLDNPDNIVTTIAEQLGIQFFGTDEPKQQLLNYFRDKQILLVLDNFEHLLSGAELISEILETASEVQIVVTSREKLSLYNEAVFSLKGLHFPDWESPEDALKYTAVQLFMQSAKLARTDFVLHENDLDYLSRICRLVQGMPLGLVLAAAWVEVLSLREIAEEISHSLDFLETETRNLPDRQKSIRAVFEYSWKRLSSEQQTSFSKLAVFRGGFTKRAAQHITGSDLRTLQLFLSKSLVMRSSEERYQIHELLRQYAEGELEQSGAVESTRDAHSQYFADFLQKRDELLKGHRQTETMFEIRADFENIRSMWARAIDTKNYTQLYQSAETLCWFCIIGEYLTDGEYLMNSACVLLEQELENKLITPLGSHLQLRLFWIQMFLYSIPKPCDDFIEKVKKWLTLAESANNQQDIALCHSFLAVLATLNEAKNALHMLEESLSRFEILGDKFYQTWALHWFVYYWEERNVETSLVYIKQSLKLHHELGGQHGLAQPLFQAAYAALELGDMEEAGAIVQEIELLDSPWLPSYIDAVRANIMFLQGDFETAQRVANTLLENATAANQLRTRHFAFLQLGLVSCIYGDYQVSLNYYEQMLALHLNPRHLAYAKWLLALAASGIGDYPRAIKASLDSLKSSMKIGAIGRMTWFLPVLTMIEIYRANYLRATHLLSLAFNHTQSPTGWLDNWPLINQLQDNLRQELGQDAYDEAFARGAQSNIETIINNLIEEFGAE